MEKISVYDLPFVQVPASREAELKYSKGIFGGVKKKFAKSLLEGKVWACEVRVIDWKFKLLHHMRGGYSDYPFGKIASCESGAICKEWCIVCWETYFSWAAEWTEEDSFNEADIEAMKKKRIGYIMKYFLGEEERYILIDKKCFQDLNLVMGSITPYFGRCYGYDSCLQEDKDE